jgi:hypothetical protein
MKLRDEIKQSLDPVTVVPPGLIANTMALVHEPRPAGRPRYVVAALAAVLFALAVVALLLSSRLIGPQVRPALTPAQPKPTEAASVTIPKVPIAGTLPPDLRHGVFLDTRATASESITFETAGPRYFSLAWARQGTIEMIVLDPDGKEAARSSSSSGGLNIAVPSGPAGTWTVQLRVQEGRGPISWAMVGQDQPISIGVVEGPVRYGQASPSPCSSNC